MQQNMKYSKKCNNIHETFIRYDWQGEMQFLGNTMQKKIIQCKKEIINEAF